MPRTPTGPKNPKRDVIQNAVRNMRELTGDKKEPQPVHAGKSSIKKKPSKR